MSPRDPFRSSPPESPVGRGFKATTGIEPVERSHRWGRVWRLPEAQRRGMEEPWWAYMAKRGIAKEDADAALTSDNTEDDGPPAA